MITPALSAAEWATKYLLIQCFESWGDESPTGVAEIKAGPDYLHLTSHQSQLVADFSAPSDRAALAALCLHGRISWEMVDALRAARVIERWENVVDEHETAIVGSVADLLESLLAPREK